MKPERWNQVDRLLDAALDLPPDKRAAFLDSACGGDEALRKEVDALLASDKDTHSFIEEPALELTAKELAGSGDKSIIGRAVGHYIAVSRLGAGGMGEVYLAEDTRLGRKVALKQLPEHLTANMAAKRRFVQEARAASALNHRHIITIYEVISEGQHDFIAMEYVDGESLRSLLAGRRMETKRAVEFAAQAASALAAAHGRAIVHRDIKPENLMVTRNSQVKVLDFGLAKLIESPSASLAGDFSTWVGAGEGIGAETAPGMVLGTVAYMSPEQAAGRALDHRADIFSLGVVLYEMLTGCKPFEGKSAVDVLHAIINQEPRSALELNPRLPPEITDILAKALAKDPEERYQHAGDLELDLRRFKRAIESNSLASASAPASVRPVRPALFWATVGVLLLVCTVTTLAWVFGRRNAPRRGAVTLEDATLRPLTTEPGYEGEPTFAPDGQTIAYVSDRNGNFDIFLKQVTGGPDVQLTSSLADDVQPAFSPDGKEIAFVSTRASPTSLFYPVTDSPLIGGDIWVMTALGDKGGNARRVVERGNFPSWSPDGKYLLYAKENWQAPKIYTVPAGGGESREIALKFRSGENPSPLLFYPRYSSDGRWIAFQTQDDGIYVLRAEGGEAQRIAQGKDPAWNAESTAIIYSNTEPGKNQALWQIPFSRAEGKTVGSAEPLTVDRGWDRDAAISHDGKLIAFTAEGVSFNVEKVPFDAEGGRILGRPQALTNGQNINFFMNFSPDARSVVFASVRGSSEHIWRVDPGAVPAQLTSDPNFNDSYPRWSPDGHTIAFTRFPANEPQSWSSLWRMAADGASPQKLLDKTAWYAWMPNSRSVVCFSLADQQLALLDVLTGEKRRITDEEGVMPVLALSPDGRWAAYQSTISGNVDLRAISTSGGSSRVVAATPRFDYHPFFSPSGSWLYFQPDHKNIYRVPGPAQGWRKADPEKVTNFQESGLFLEDPQLSRDGRWLLYSHGHITGDIWIMRLGK